MSIWQLNAALQGYADAHTPEKPGAMTAQEADDVWAWMHDGKMH